MRRLVEEEEDEEMRRRDVYIASPPAPLAPFPIIIVPGFLLELYSLLAVTKK